MHHWTFEDIRKLTWFQITEIVFHERDEKGRIIWGKKEVLTARELFGKRWREWGLSEEIIAHKWDEFLAVEGHKYHLEQRGVKPEEIARQAAEFERGIVAKRKWGR